MSAAFLTTVILSLFFSAQWLCSMSSLRASVKLRCMQTVRLVAVSPPLWTSSSHMFSAT